MREKLKVRHDEVLKLRIESQEIVKLQHKENSLNIKIIVILFRQFKAAQFRAHWCETLCL